MNTKNRRNASVQVDYLVHIQEIKPWPPSQSLRSLRSVLIQWENGDRHSGSTNTVVPSIGSIVGEGTIEFNESFRLPVTLQRDTSSRGKDEITFKKNCLEFNLYEPRRDKTQLLATAVIDLADYGVLKEPIIITSPMSSKRILTNSSQPVLCIKMQPVEKRRGSSSSRGDLSRVMSLDNGSGSLSSLMNEEYAEEAETASITDDDVSSQSSLANAGLSHHNESNGSEKMGNNHGGIRSENVRASRLQTEKLTASLDRMKLSSSPSSSMDFSSELCSPVNGHSPSLASPESSSISISNVDDPSRVKSLSHSSSGNKDVELKANGVEVQQEATGDMVASKKESNSENGLHLVASLDNDSETSDNLGSAGSGESMADEEDNDETQTTRSASSAGTSYRDGSYANYMENEIGGHPLEQKRHLLEDPQVGYSSQGDTGDSRLKGNIIRPDHLKHIKSVRSPSDSVRGNGTALRNQISKMEELGSVGNALTRAGILKVDEQIRSPKNINTVLGSKIQLLEDKIKMLEGELRETAAIEAALYSVAAEHGSSMSKVHAPARRLSRLYLHACRDQSQLRRATAARSAVSGLVLVAKACGHDVPRLTFWLSNSVALRAIVSQVIGNKELPLSSASSREMNSGEKGNKKIPSPLRWKELSPGRKENGQCLQDEYGDWDDPNTFTSALEKVEAWIFCRTVESIWWQTLTPHMQSAATKVIQRTLDSGSKKTLQKISSGDHDKENIAIDHWNGAFKDACERLCPVRAGGHDCGCLPMLTRLIMEQCVARLDVAMFNAILRESADEMPTDPVSDPITNPNILPIPAGISSFGAGAQLKTVIGNWSRWLSDLFGMDDDDMHDDGSDKMETDESAETSFKSFNLLNALSDLMMLPKDMLLSESIRKEVCPTFGAPLIKRVLDNFVIDEFCPDPIPEVVHEALNSEDDAEVEDSISTIPCLAAPPTYQPPSAASVTAIIGDCDCKSHLRRSGSSVLRKAYTSDDELDELNSPLAAIIREGSRSSTSPWRTSWKPKEQGSLSTIRYQLLRDIWINSE